MGAHKNTYSYHGKITPVSPRSVQIELLKCKTTQKFYYDRHTRTLSKLNIGDSVLIQTKDTWYPAKVTKIKHTTPRSYFVTTLQEEAIKEIEDV